MEYREGYLAFIDVLGFSTFVSEETNGAKTFDLFEFVRKFRYLFNNSPQLKTKVSFFSDSIVLTADTLDDLILPIYIAESFVQDKMGLLFRGGICYGKYYHENDVTFGPAVIRAYKLEGKAIYSRIILDDEIRLPDENSILFFTDVDGWICLNPMSVVLNEPVAYGGDKPAFPTQNVNEVINDRFSKHRNEILSSISRHKGSTVVDKYLWRIRPFNYTCNLLADLPCGEVLYKEIGFSMNEQLQKMLKNQIITGSDVDKC